MARLVSLHNLTTYLTKATSYNKLQSRKSASFFKEKFIELNEDTLTGRLLTYLSNFKVQNEDRRTDVKYNQIHQIEAPIKNTDTTRSKINLSTIHAFDKKCCNLVKSTNTSEIFENLHVFMKIVPHRITKFRYYDMAISELSKRLKSFSKNDIIQYIFYVGLEKKNSTYHNAVRFCLKNLNKSGLDVLTAEDLCVVCNSTFKTTTKISNDQFLSNIINYLYNNLHLFKDSAIFITFLKSIRHNRYQDEELLATMSCTFFFNKTLECYSFSALCHILAVYSDYLYHDENILKVFTEKCISILKESSYTHRKEHMSIQPRLKDIKRMLWCLSNLNYNDVDKNDIKNIIIPCILERVNKGDVEENFSSLIEISLYLWMLNYRPYELVPYFLNKQVTNSINELNTPIKQRLNLLLTCIYFEDKSLLKQTGLYPKLNVEYNMDNQLDKRPLLNKVMNNLKDISKTHEINRYEMNSQIPGLNIIGITGYKKNIYKAVYIEVLDEYTTLKNTKKLPTGLMQLKLRLLEHLDEAVILIDCDEIETMADSEIKQVLLDEMEFVC